MTDTPNAAQLVAMAGKALYGEAWQSPLARALNVQLRTVQRVAEAAREGRDYPAARAWLDDLGGQLHTLMAELDARQGDCRAAARALFAYRAPPRA